jgi:hypothetical protein
MLAQQPAPAQAALGAPASTEDRFYTLQRRVVARYRPVHLIHRGIGAAALAGTVILGLGLSVFPISGGPLAVALVVGMVSVIYFLWSALLPRLNAAAAPNHIGWSHVAACVEDLAACTPKQLRFLIQKAQAYRAGMQNQALLVNICWGIILAVIAVQFTSAPTVPLAILTLMLLVGISVLLVNMEPSNAAVVIELAALHQLERLEKP